MHKIQKNTKINSRKTLVIIAVALLLIICATLGYLWSKEKSAVETDSTSSTDINVTPENSKGTQQPDTLPDNSQNLTTEDVPVDESASANISRLEQIDTTVYFDAIVTNATELGRCVVVFSTPNDRPITKEFDATKKDDRYICSLSLSALEFSYLGTWDVTFRYYNGPNQVIAKGTIKIS
jgi:hypothetical protein